MTTWSQTLLESVVTRLSGHEYWKTRVEVASTCPESAPGVHLAVFVEPFLQYVLDGRKTIESRFSIHRRPPFGCVQAGDLILIKQSAGPIVALAEVSAVWYYQLDASARNFIRARFSEQLCIEDPDFWDAKAEACYATLMQFARLERLEPFACDKRDRRGWVVLQSTSDSQPTLLAEVSR